MALALATATAGCAGDEEEDIDQLSGSSSVSAASRSAGRYIVAFRASRGSAGRAALHAAGGSVALDLGPQNAVAAHLPAQALTGLQNNPNVEYIEEDVTREPTAQWNDLATGSGTEIMPFGVQMVQGNRVSSPSASNRTVCIIDSGYSQQHADLRDETSSQVSGNDNSGSGHWDMDSCGHGTHVAGTIAAVAGNNTGVVGVNPGVRLHIVKIFGNDDLAGGACNWTYASNLVAALNECRNAGANVVNMSLGGGAKSRTEENAFKSAYAAGVLSIASAGNAGTASTSFPAGYASVMSVAAIDANEVVADFSQKNRDVEIAAPGVAVLSTVPWLEDNSLSAGNDTWTGLHIEGAARTAGVSGLVVDGGQCTSAGAWAGKVVLCQRGTNSFAAKVGFVQSGGGAAAVIYNLVTSDATCGDFSGTLGDGVSNSTPAITLSCAEGASALGAAGSTGSVVSTLTLPDSSYEAWDGTSMAAPHVSAVAALIWSCNPSRTNAQIRDALVKSARDLGTAGRDNSYGFGLVQARTALERLGLGNCTVN